MAQNLFSKMHGFALVRFSAICFFLIGVAPSLALEIPQITPATATEPACMDPQFYIDQNPLKMGTTMSSTCHSCKAQINNAVESANGKLTAAAGRDASIAASATASTQGSAAAAGANQFQNDHMFKTGDVNQTGLNAVTQQEALARGVAEGYEQCARDIDSACSNVAPADKAMADQAKQSCTSSANQARGVAADKTAKAAQMAQDGQQANQNGQGMQPPQMPQGGAGGSGLGSDPFNSKISSDINKPKTAKLDSGFSGGKTEIPLNQVGDSGLSSQKFTPEKSLGSASSLSSSEKESTSANGAPGSSGSASRNGVSGSGASMGSSGFGSNGGSEKDSDSSKTRNPAAAADGASELAGGAQSSFKPTLGLRSSGNELNDLLQTPGGPIGSETIGSTQEALGHSSGSSHNLSSVGEEVSLFQRIRTKITIVTRARHMQ